MVWVLHRLLLSFWNWKASSSPKTPVPEPVEFKLFRVPLSCLIAVLLEARPKSFYAKVLKCRLLVPGYFGARSTELQKMMAPAEPGTLEGAAGARCHQREHCRKVLCPGLSSRVRFASANLGIAGIQGVKSTPIHPDKLPIQAPR